MKKLGILLVLASILLLSCSRKTKPEVKEEDDFLKIPEYTTEEYKPAYTAPKYTSPSDSTYWYVVLDAEDASWHGTVSLGTQYFDFLEARKQFEGAQGKGYFEFILQITRESVDTYHKYSVNK